MLINCKKNNRFLEIFITFANYLEICKRQNFCKL